MNTRLSLNAVRLICSMGDADCCGALHLSASQVHHACASSLYLGNASMCIIVLLQSSRLWGTCDHLLD